MYSIVIQEDDKYIHLKIYLIELKKVIHRICVGLQKYLFY